MYKKVILFSPKFLNMLHHSNNSYLNKEYNSNFNNLEMLSVRGCVRLILKKAIIPKDINERLDKIIANIFFNATLIK